MFRLLLLNLIFSLHISAAYAGPHAANTVDDTFLVRKVEARQAVLQGKTKPLKVGDELYFARSPFKFTITEVKGEMVTIALPEKNDIAVGNTLVRTQTAAMKKAMQTELNLKSALEE